MHAIPFKIELTPEAAEVAAEFSTPHAVAEYARVELIGAGLGEVDLARAIGPGGDILAAYHFELGGRTWGVWPAAPGTWALVVVPEKSPVTPVLPAYQLVFTERAKRTAHQHDLSIEYVEMEARMALARCEPEDCGCALFSVPVLEIAFRAWPLDGNGYNGGRVEIDAVDEDQTAASE